MKLTLKKLFLNLIDMQPRGYAETLAEIAGYSSGGNLKKIFKDEKKEFDNFDGLVKLVRHSFPDQEHEIMENYSKTLDGKSKTARMMLEYLSSHRLLKSMKSLIEKMMVCGNKESEQWAKVYALQFEWQNNYHNIDIDKHYINVRNLKTNVDELIIFQKLMAVYCHYYRDNHKAAHEMIREIKEDLQTINNEFIKKSYETKLNETLSYINLWVLNKPEEARENARVVLSNNIGLTFDAYAYFIIGYSNFYTSYEEAIENLNKSVDIYKYINRKEAAQNSAMMIEKLNVFWGKEMGKHFFISKQAKLWYYAKNNIDFESMLTSESSKTIYSPFKTLANGLKENNNDLLMQSMIQFLKHGDAYQARIPMLELLKRGYSEIVLNELITIYSM